MSQKEFGYYATQPIESLLKEFNTSKKNGLSKEQVLIQQKEFGINQIFNNKIHWWHILLSQFKSPFIFLYILIALLLLFVNEFTNFIIIILCVTITIITGFYQEFRAFSGLKALKRYLKPTARVIRNGKEQEIASAELVPGDIIFLEPGDVIPADIRFIETQDITVDESSITGESISVPKTASDLNEHPESLYEAHTIGFSGTIVSTGKAIAVVFAIGQSSMIGSIAHLTFDTMQDSKLAQSTAQLGHFVIIIVFAILAFMFALNLYIKGSSISLFDLFIFTITLAVAAIPEALPLVITFCLSQGAMRLAKHQVIVKRLSAVEDLGSIQVLCTDKTGTITENKLSIVSTYGIHAENAIIYGSISKETLSRTPKLLNGFDRALWHYLRPNEQHRVKASTLHDEAPFDPIKRRSLRLITFENKTLLIAKGAFEEIIDRCSDISDEEHKKLTLWVEEQGLAGNRIIAIANKEIIQHPTSELLWSLENNMTLLGCISFEDPLKKTASAALAKANKLGIQVKIISGDSPHVCSAIAQQLNLITDAAQVVTGKQLASLSDAQKHEIIKNNAVFARITPEQKYEIIQYLQHQYIVGYLGDGINDAPALKAANVSLAVPGAAFIAKDAADIILLRNSLRVVIEGIHQGRIVVANTLKYIKTTMASNLGNCYAIAIASLLIEHLPMLPIQILLLNLFSDFPMIALSTDTVDTGELKSPALYVLKQNIVIIFLLGIISSFSDFIYFGLFKKYSPEVLQTGWFVLSILTEVAFIFSIRTTRFFLFAKRPSAALLLISLVVCAGTIFLPQTAFGQHVLHFTPLSITHYIYIGLIVVLFFASTEITKYWYYRAKN